MRRRLRKRATNWVRARKPIVRGSTVGAFTDRVFSGDVDGPEVSRGGSAVGGANGPAEGREVPDSGRSGRADDDPPSSARRGVLRETWGSRVRLEVSRVPNCAALLG
jgi:hypothetical protein